MKFPYPKLFLIIIVAIFNSCNQPVQQKQAKKPTAPYDPLNGLPESQKKVVLAFKSYGADFDSAPNDIAKNNIQDKFNTWLKSYLIDTLKGNIKNWAVVVNDVKGGELPTTNYIYVKFDGYLPTGFEGKHWSLYQETDTKNTKKSALYSKVKDLQTGKAARLSAKLIAFDGYEVSDFATNLRMPEFKLQVDAVSQ